MIKISDVPKLRISRWHGGTSKPGLIHFEEHEHRDLPHVVKFSGGRSSGMMLLMLIKNKILKPERGDVVLFLNTAAEHPATYDFVAKMKRFSEKAGIPFFIAQLQTFETVVGGEWRRNISYRLVNERPISNKNPNGYNFRGEVFEESIAWAGMLPTLYTRMCTTLMKMLITRQFLADWFACKDTISMLGHNAGQRECDSIRLHDRHRRNKGQMTKKEFNNRWEYLSKCRPDRPEQKFNNFSKAKLPKTANKLLKPNIWGGKCDLFGKEHASFITHLGFRYGEKARVQRMIARNNGEETPGHDTNPPGEYSYAPLYDLGIDQEQVKAFWAKQPRSIRPYLPEDLNLSNCVYCFLKGSKNLIELEHKKKNFEKTLPKKLRDQCRITKSPNNITWWQDLEERYARRSRKVVADGEVPPSFGMFGLTTKGYRKLKATAKSSKKSNRKVIPLFSADESATCECTD